MIRKFKKKQGITMISLVITLIVLLILAGVSLAMVFNQNGIFKKAEQTTDKYGQAKAQETLELMLNEARMQKYERGLTEVQLTEKINSIGKELEKEDETSSKQKIIVEGYIFEIDRSTPKFLKYIGPADGIVITSSTIQNGNWQNQKATVTGEIKIYGDGKVISSSARVTSGSYEITGFPKTGGAFTLGNITEDVDIEIIATDNKERTVTRTIEIRLVKDDTAPILSEAKAEVDRMKIKISIKAEDDVSGVKEIKYNVEPKETITPNEGTLTSGEEVELISEVAGKYTIRFIAEDNAENSSEEVITEATTVRGIKKINTPEGLKTVNAKDIYGAEVTGYKCKKDPTGTNMQWQIFYIDENDDNRVYLISKSIIETPPRTTNGWPLTQGDKTFAYYWNANALYEYKRKILDMPFTRKFFKEFVNVDATNQENLQAVNYMLDQNAWKEYKSGDNESELAIGGPTLPLYIMSYNEICDKGKSINLVTGPFGYVLEKRDDSSNDLISTDYVRDDLQMGIYCTGAYSNFWIAGPADCQDFLFYAGQRQWISNQPVTNYRASGFRPLVGLSINEIFRQNEDGTYTIQ